MGTTTIMIIGFTLLSLSFLALMSWVKHKTKTILDDNFIDQKISDIHHAILKEALHSEKMRDHLRERINRIEETLHPQKKDKKPKCKHEKNVDITNASSKIYMYLCLDCGKVIKG